MYKKAVKLQSMVILVRLLTVLAVKGTTEVVSHQNSFYNDSLDLLMDFTSAMLLEEEVPFVRTCIVDGVKALKENISEEESCVVHFMESLKDYISDFKNQVDCQTRNLQEVVREFVKKHHPAIGDDVLLKISTEIEALFQEIPHIWRIPYSSAQYYAACYEELELERSSESPILNFYLHELDTFAEALEKACDPISSFHFNIRVSMAEFYKSFQIIYNTPRHGVQPYYGPNFIFDSPQSILGLIYECSCALEQKFQSSEAFIQELEKTPNGDALKRICNEITSRSVQLGGTDLGNVGFYYEELGLTRDQFLGLQNSSKHVPRLVELHEILSQDTSIEPLSLKSLENTSNPLKMADDSLQSSDWDRRMLTFSQKLVEKYNVEFLSKVKEHKDQLKMQYFAKLETLKINPTQITVDSYDDRITPLLETPIRQLSYAASIIYIEFLAHLASLSHQNFTTEFSDDPVITEGGQKSSTQEIISNTE